MTTAPCKPRLLLLTDPVEIESARMNGLNDIPAQLVLQDVLTLHGRQFKEASLIVASPPCQEYSYMAMPWTKAKARAHEYRTAVRDVKELTALFDACFRLQQEAREAAIWPIPMVVENVRGAIPWVGRSRWNYGSYHMWGDVPALMPMTVKRAALKAAITHRSDGSTNFHGQKNNGGSWFNVAHNTTSGKGHNPDSRCDGIKVGGIDWSKRDANGKSGVAFNTTADQRLRLAADDGIKQGGDWFNSSAPSISRMTGSKSSARKYAAAAIAKIPLPLARYIARTYYAPLEEPNP